MIALYNCVYPQRKEKQMKNLLKSRRFITVMVIFFITLGVGGFLYFKHESSKKLTLLSKTFNDKEDFFEAEKLASKAIKRNPSNAEAYFELSRAFVMAYQNERIMYREQDTPDENIDLAMDSINVALSLQPDEIKYQIFKMSIIYGVESHYSSRIPFLYSDIIENPGKNRRVIVGDENHQFKCWKFQSNKIVQEYTFTSKCCSSKCNNDYCPYYVKKIYNIAIERFQENRFDVATAIFNAVLHLDPGHPKAYYNRGLALFNLNLFDLARSDFQKAISSGEYKKSGYAHYYLGNCNFNLGQKEKAKKYLKKALQLKPSLKSQIVKIFPDLK